MSLQSLPGTSRVWTFVSSRVFSADENAIINSALEEFVSDWKAHGNELSAGYEICLNCILVVAVDEAYEAPSGCSIDKVFRLLQQIGEEHGMDFFDRTLIAKKDGEKVFIWNKSEAENAARQNILLPDDLVFNGMIKSLDEFRTMAFIPFKNSWLGSRLLIA